MAILKTDEEIQNIIKYGYLNKSIKTKLKIYRFNKKYFYNLIDIQFTIEKIYFDDSYSKTCFITISKFYGVLYNGTDKYRLTFYDSNILITAFEKLFTKLKYFNIKALIIQYKGQSIYFNFNS